MKCFLLLIGGIMQALAAAAPDVRIGLVPSGAMGRRAGADFNEVVWSVDSEWFHKLAPVCKTSSKPMDLSKFHELALAYQMRPFWNKNLEEALGSKSDGAFHYRSDMINGGVRVASGSPKIHKFHFKIARYFKFERDKHQEAIVNPLPSKEEAVTIAREWMKKLGIDENELYRQGDEPQGFDVVFRIDLERGYQHGTKIDKEYHYGITLNFAQQIGGLSVLWHGNGGTLVCEIGDGSEFCSMYGTLSGWEKIGDYPVLNREEITQALKEKYFWDDTPFECDSIEIIKVRLEVFHANEDAHQKDFPLIYTFCCKLHGGKDNGKEENLYMPALKQQRNCYGPPPAGEVPTEEEGKPAVEVESF